MPISFKCQNCQKAFNVKDEMAGKSAKCQCGVTIVVPASDDILSQDFSAYESSAPTTTAPLPPTTPTGPAVTNPYGSPPSSAPAGGSGRPQAAGSCPRCSSHSYSKVHWTWWGGFIGPLIIKTVACTSCGAHFNPKTGKSNTTAIMIYFGVTFGVAIGLMICCGGFAAIAGLSN